MQFPNNLECIIPCPTLFPYYYQLAMSKWAEENKSCLYLIDGSETLGAYLRIQPRSENAPQLSKCAIQWYRVSSDGSRNEAISGIHSVNVIKE